MSKQGDRFKIKNQIYSTEKKPRKTYEQAETY